MGFSIAERRPPRRRLLRLLLISALLIAATSTAAAIHVDAYALTPGSATPMGPRMTFTPPQPRVGGQVSMVDVNISQMTLLARVIADATGGPRHFPGSAFGFEGTDGLEKYFEQSYLTMDQAKHDAVIAAFHAVGQPIANITTGLLVYDATASSSLHLGDFVEAVNGKRVTTTCELARALNAGTTAVATVRHGHLGRSTGAVRFGPPTRVILAPTRQPHGLSTYGGSRCFAAPTTMFGLRLVNPAHLETSVPAVSINTAQIGGPSAGFAMALYLANRLQGGQLLRGRAVAATGTIDADGKVGNVGGVPEKAVAVGNAKLTIFFVPRDEVDAARVSAQRGIQVVGVDSLDEAIAALTSPESA